MNYFDPDYLRALLHSVQTPVWIIWSGMGVLTLALLVLMRTRFGRIQPLRKCVVLSIFAHLLLFAYAATIKIVGAPGPPAQETAFLVTSVKAVEGEAEPSQESAAKPWQKLPEDTPAAPEMRDLERPGYDPEPPPLDRPEVRPSDAAPFDPTLLTEEDQPQPQPPTRDASLDASNGLAAPQPAAIDRQPQVPQPKPREDVRFDPPEPEDATPRPDDARKPIDNETPRTASQSLLPDEQPEVPKVHPVAGAEPKRSRDRLDQSPRESVDSALTADRQQPAEKPKPDRTPGELSPVVESSMADHIRAAFQPRRREDRHGPASDTDMAQIPTSIDRVETAYKVPPLYEWRNRVDRKTVVESRGGSPDTEAAVKAALAWMADQQAGDGRWDAAKHGALWERTDQGTDRRGSGMKVDSAVTGLALLAFLGAGHTHQNGHYRDNVRGGVDYLIRIQATDGSLAGDAARFAAMYCHGMATLALAEAYGMTGDERLREPLRKALAYTVRAQNPRQGGWRYSPSDDRWRNFPTREAQMTGDTSQLGWQLMAIKAAELAGMEVPADARAGARRFITSVSSGRHGGLASYRVSEAPDHVMTAEALFCRFLLGSADNASLTDEAAERILEHLPSGGGQANFYYWYYATLAMYQIGDDRFETWNRALQSQLLSTQQTDGSWSADTRYGGHGGRVYTTALATLCLEVYYRFTPEITLQPNGRRWR